MKFIFLWLIATSALGGTYLTYKPIINLSPGQCITVNRNRICAVKAYPIEKCDQPPAEPDAYLCEEGFITTGLTGWLLFKNGERISIYLSNEREKCEAEIKKLKGE